MDQKRYEKELREKRKVDMRNAADDKKKKEE